MENKSRPTSHECAAGVDGASQSQEARQWRHFGCRETIRCGPYYRTFLFIFLAADKVYL